MDHDDAKWPPDDVEADRPSQARVYDYLLGGNHNLAVDRETARWVEKIMPDAADQARANRAFLQRAVRYLISVGVRQFLDIGSGIPTVGNVHEIAQQLDPEARIVYVDIEPIAVAHSRSILANNDRATAIQEDIRRPDSILTHPEVQAMLDVQKPIGLLLLAVLHVVPNEDGPYRIVHALQEGLATGSHLAVSHPTSETRIAWGPVLARAEQAGSPIVPRTRAEIERLFAGLDLVPPGLVRLPHWRPDDSATQDADADWCNAYGGVAIKP